MVNETRKSRWPVAMFGAVAALIIIAVAVVASRPGSDPDAQPAEKPAEKAAEAPAAKASHSISNIVWHETPRDQPATVFKDANDADQTLANFAGKVLVVNFWATWCAPCVKEMPTLDALQTKMGGPDFQVIAISQDRQGAKVAKPFAEKNEWKLPFYVEAAGQFMRDAKLVGLPTTLIIDKNGKEVARLEGELDWNSPEVEKILRDLMAKG